MDWCSVYLTPLGLPKYIYLSPPLIFPSTYNGIRTKNHPVWITPGAAPIRWMGPVTKNKLCINFKIMAQRSVYNIINPVCVTKNKYIIYKVQDYDSMLHTTTLLNQLPVIRYDNVTLSPLLLPARVTNRSHSTYVTLFFGW
jgi:hypothetical protein